jgi:hypothetical protein
VGDEKIIDGLDGDGNGVSVRKLGRSEMSMSMWLLIVFTTRKNSSYAFTTRK